MQGRRESEQSHMKAGNGAWLRRRILEPEPLLAPGAYDAFSAKLIEAAGWAEAIYCGGYATTASAYGLPDVGMTGFRDMFDVYERIVEAISLPLIVDIDTGYGDPLNVTRSVEMLRRLDIAGAHIEDQVQPKRCGHVAGKAVVSKQDAAERVENAVKAAGDDGPAIIARTDALAVEGLDSVLERSRLFTAAGASAIFVDAVTSIDELRAVRSVTDLPLLFNTAPTGVSPVLSRAEWKELRVGLVIFPVQLLMGAMDGVNQMLRLIQQGIGDQIPVTFEQLSDITGLNAYLAAAQAREVA